MNNGVYSYINNIKNAFNRFYLNRAAGVDVG